MRLLPLVLIAALTGCLKQATPPDPGKCASGPPGKSVWTWGEIRIGTCLAGPADVQFFEQDGKTWLGVTNANPYIDYATGSFLLIDWDSIDLDVDLNLMHELDASALPIDDYVGGMGVLSSRRQALVTGRRSDGVGGRVAADTLYVVDIDDPLALHLDRDQPILVMRDDPFPVVIDAPNERAYIGNLTDHSVAVLDTSGERIEKVDVAPGTSVLFDPLIDVDGSGSTASLSSVEIFLPEDLTNDLWDLTYVDGVSRIWVPTSADDLGTPGLERYTDVGMGPVASALGIEVDPEFFDPIRDPSYVDLGQPWIYYTNPEGSVIERATNGGTDGLGPIGDWNAGTRFTELRAGGEGDWDAVLGGPQLEVVDDRLWLFYDGRQPNGAPALGVAIAPDQNLFENAAAPFLTADTEPGFAGFEDPTPWHDVSHDGVRVWMTAILDDGSTAIGLTETRDDGDSWSPVELVLSEPGADLSGPVVRRSHGRFEIWYTRDDGTAWTHANAWSWDGRVWFDSRDLVTSDLPYELGVEAPSVAVQRQNTSAWSIEGRDSGKLNSLITSGTLFINPNQGFTIRLASGQEIENDVVPDGRAEVGLKPGSTIEVGGFTRLYATVEDDSRTRLAVLERVGTTWLTLASDLIPAGTGGNNAGVSDPVVVQSGDHYTLFYAATNGLEITQIRRATSPDGLNWTPVPGPVLTHEDPWDGVQQLPHSVRVQQDGTVRLWYAGGNGGRLRIGAATANSPDGKFTAERGEFDPWRFEPGVPGSFDDGGVRDPVVYADDDGLVHLIYAGFDGTQWSLGHATQSDRTFTRRIDAASDRSLPAMPGELFSFAHQGAVSPVLLSRSGEDLELLYGGIDGFNTRIGRAIGRPERMWPTVRFPTVGDAMSFSTEQGRTGNSVVELAQSTQTFFSTGIGMSGITMDADRGMLYVPSKLESYFYVVDIRDDSGGALEDANALDLEGVVAVASLGGIGFRDALVDSPRDRLYLTARNPDGVVIVDLTRLVDDDAKDVTWHTASAVLPLQTNIDDRGEDTVASIGGAGMALTEDGRYLLVTHHRANGLAVFDLERDAWGSEIAWLQGIGENPHIVRISPDGKYAVVANYVGEILGNGAQSSSTLAIVDLDPTSDRFLEVLTWLGNR